MLLIDPLHEDLLSRVASPGRGFMLWLRGVLSPLGLVRLPGALFRGRNSADRIWGRSAGSGGKALFAKLQESLERVVESAARSLADQFHDELAGLVTGTIQRWDAEQTSSQLELLLGRVLQFIRINGTVVGAGVGLALHAIALALA